jgi:hypothetical protein
MSKFDTQDHITIIRCGKEILLPNVLLLFFLSVLKVDLFNLWTVEETQSSLVDINRLISHSVAINRRIVF